MSMLLGPGDEKGTLKWWTVRAGKEEPCSSPCNERAIRWHMRYADAKLFRLFWFAVSR